MTKTYSFPKERVQILLLEGVHPVAADEFAGEGYTVRIEPSSMSEHQLVEIIPDIHILGVRSRTRITKTVLDASRRLIAVGCYCIGTNQVALDAAAAHGIPVFNAPFSSTRSVAELAMAEIVMLARRAAHRSMQLHQGVWEKTAEGAFEVRHKTLGVVGYGHVGPQVGLLAESFGMQVVFYDIARKLPLGTATPLPSLRELLRVSDFVTLHVPETPLTRNMIGAAELGLMKAGSYLLNLSRGSVVDVGALREALLSGHLAGAAVDVYPSEPRSGKEPFQSELRGLDNVVLTPHIGGSTIEAQRSIGIDVSRSLIGFTDTGNSSGAVNFPAVEPPVLRDGHRVLNVHHNVPGVLRDINRIVAETGANVQAQHLSTNADIGYLIMDVDPTLSRDVKRSIEVLDTNIKTRLLF